VKKCSSTAQCCLIAPHAVEKVHPRICVRARAVHVKHSNLGRNAFDQANSKNTSSEEPLILLGTVFLISGMLPLQSNSLTFGGDIEVSHLSPQNFWSDTKCGTPQLQIIQKQQSQIGNDERMPQDTGNNLDVCGFLGELVGCISVSGLDRETNMQGSLNILKSPVLQHWHSLSVFRQWLICHSVIAKCNRAHRSFSSLLFYNTGTA
jgi:hypothetical protein